MACPAVLPVILPTVRVTLVEPEAFLQPRVIHSATRSCCCEDLGYKKIPDARNIPCGTPFVGVPTTRVTRRGNGPGGLNQQALEKGEVAKIDNGISV